MLKAGDKVKYGVANGEVVNIYDGMAIVKLEDGKEYTVDTSMLKIDESNKLPFEDLISDLRPHLKKVDFLNALANELSKSGVSELHVKNGTIQSFLAKESLEERIARYKAEALAEAERKAKEDHEKETV